MEEITETTIKKQAEQAEEPVKRGRGRPKGSLGKNNQLYHKREIERFVNGMVARDKNGVSTEDNKRYSAHTLEVANLPVVNFMIPEQVRERINKYFQICDKNDLKPNIAGLSLSLHIDRNDLISICNGQKKCPQETIDILKQARRMLNDLLENYQYDNKSNPVSMIFLAKNNFGYKDQTEMVVNSNNQFGDVQDVGQLRDKYLSDVVDDSIDEQK